MTNTVPANVFAANQPDRKRSHGRRLEEVILVMVPPRSQIEYISRYWRRCSARMSGIYARPALAKGGQRLQSRIPCTQRFHIT
jgi:hypothetical protein